MGTTPIYAIPYTEPSDDVATYPAQDRAQAEAVEAAIETPVWCEASNNASPPLTHNVTTDITFNGASQEPAGQWTSGNTIKIVRAGLYQITVAASWANNAVGTRTLSIKRNGAQIRAFSHPVTAGNGYAGAQFSMMLRCALNDTIGMAMWQNTGSTITAATAPSPTLTLLRLGS